jgi:hypothetical protein
MDVCGRYQTSHTWFGKEQYEVAKEYDHTGLGRISSLNRYDFVTV